MFALICQNLQDLHEEEREGSRSVNHGYDSLESNKKYWDVPGISQNSYSFMEEFSCNRVFN